MDVSQMWKMYKGLAECFEYIDEAVMQNLTQWCSEPCDLPSEWSKRDVAVTYLEYLIRKLGSGKINGREIRFTAAYLFGTPTSSSYLQNDLKMALLQCDDARMRRAVLTDIVQRARRCEGMPCSASSPVFMKAATEFFAGCGTDDHVGRFLFSDKPDVRSVVFGCLADIVDHDKVLTLPQEARLEMALGCACFAPCTENVKADSGTSRRQAQALLLAVLAWLLPDMKNSEMLSKAVQEESCKRGGGHAFALMVFWLQTVCAADVVVDAGLHFYKQPVNLQVRALLHFTPEKLCTTNADFQLFLKDTLLACQQQIPCSERFELATWMEGVLPAHMLPDCYYDRCMSASGALDWLAWMPSARMCLVYKYLCSNKSDSYQLRTILQGGTRHETCVLPSAGTRRALMTSMMLQGKWSCVAVLAQEPAWQGVLDPLAVAQETFCGCACLPLDARNGLRKIMRDPTEEELTRAAQCASAGQLVAMLRRLDTLTRLKLTDLKDGVRLVISTVLCRTDEHSAEILRDLVAAMSNIPMSPWYDPSMNALDAMFNADKWPPHWGIVARHPLFFGHFVDFEKIPVCISLAQFRSQMGPGPFTESMRLHVASSVLKSDHPSAVRFALHMIGGLPDSAGLQAIIATIDCKRAMYNH